MSTQVVSQHVSTTIARLRSDLGVTQGIVAQQAGLDQSRVSRIEKGEVAAPAEVEKVIDALAHLGSKDAKNFKEFSVREWKYVEPPSFWNPQRGYLETAEETLAAVDAFLMEEDHPWPLRRQLERRRDDLLKSTTFLSRTKHNLAFIGEMGIGKSAALNFLFDLLAPASPGDKTIGKGSSKPAQAEQPYARFM